MLRKETLQRAAGVLVGLALVVVPAAARTDDFQDHVDRAASLAKAERYTDALAELQAAHALKQSPRLLYLRAQVQQRLGEANAALSGYQAFLAAEPDADVALREDAKAQIAKLRPLVEQTAPPPRARSAGTPLLFMARDSDDTYLVSIGTRQCVTPCRLSLAPGPHQVFATGEGAFDFRLDVPARPGIVRIQRPWNGMLKAGVAMMTIGSIMMIAGNTALLVSFGNEGSGSGAVLPAVITFGWALGPAAHLIGVGLMAGSLSKLSDANTVQPVGFEVGPTMHGTTGRVRFSF